MERQMHRKRKSLARWIMGFVFLIPVVSEGEELTCSAERGYHREHNRPLYPSDLPSIQLFQDWQNNSTVSILSSPKPTNIEVSYGSIAQAGQGDFSAEFDLLKNLVRPDEYQAMLTLLQANWLQSALDTDLDSVDGYATQEFMLDNEYLREGGKSKPGVESAKDFRRRKSLRAELMRITQPILEERLTPYINQRLPGCKNQCTPCYSLLRRYRYGERQGHFPHRDSHAYATVVVSLSDHGDDFLGGLYVASVSSNPYFLNLRKGDAVLHQMDLLHGVKTFPVAVNQTTSTNDEVRTSDQEEKPHLLRWSWILWYKDTDRCSESSATWFTKCANEGNPTCAYMQSVIEGRKQWLSEDERDAAASKWNRKAAELGEPTACVKLARQLLMKQPSRLTPSRKEAMKYYKRAIESANDPDAHYGIATEYLQEATKRWDEDKPFQQYVYRAVQHLEASAIGGNPYAMFNLGIANWHGYGCPRNMTLAADWLEASAIPEGYALASRLYTSMGQEDFATELKQRAKALGYGTRVRQASLSTIGYPTTGADFNLEWPPTDLGEVPPSF